MWYLVAVRSGGGGSRGLGKVRDLGFVQGWPYLWAGFVGPIQEVFGVTSFDSGQVRQGQD